MRLSLSFLFALWFLVPACIGPCAGPTYSESKPLTEPWVGLHIPVDDVVVVASDAATVQLHDPVRSVADATSRISEALEAAGWSMSFDGSASGITNQTWDKDGAMISLTVMEDRGASQVSLTILQ